MHLLLDSFDTQTYTRNFPVSKLNYVRSRIVARSETSKDGYSQLYLHITGNGNRKRLPLKVYVLRKYWDSKKARVLEAHPNAYSTNLVIQNFEATITQIRTEFQLSHKQLTVKLLAQEFQHGIPRIYVTSYFEHRLERMTNIVKGTRKRYKSVIAKLDEMAPQLTFHEIDNSFPDKYRKYWLKKNKASTVESNLSAIKDFLRKAELERITFPLQMELFKLKKITGKREYLYPSEVKRLQAYFYSEFISRDHKKVLAYFLTACYTGRRISEILDFKREAFQESHASVISSKTGKKQTIAATAEFYKMIDELPELFVKHLTPQYINRELKKIMKSCSINKTVTMHVGRHTFATTFLRNKVSGVEDLQIILGHSKITQTMEYVHIVKEETLSSFKNFGNMFD